MLKSYFGRLGGAFLNSRRGATAIEYGLLAALVGVVIVAGATALGSGINGKLNSTANTVTTAGSAGS
jgi:pilus assembly protein Flp/PilA